MSKKGRVAKCVTVYPSHHFLILHIISAASSAFRLGAVNLPECSASHRKLYHRAVGLIEVLFIPSPAAFSSHCLLLSRSLVFLLNLFLSTFPITVSIKKFWFLFFNKTIRIILLINVAHFVVHFVFNFILYFIKFLSAFVYLISLFIRKRHTVFFKVFTISKYF